MAEHGKVTVQIVPDTSAFEDALKSARKAMGMLMLVASTGNWLEEHFWELETQAERYKMPLDEFVAHLLDTSFEAHKSLSDEDIKASHHCEKHGPVENFHPEDDGGPGV